MLMNSHDLEGGSEVGDACLWPQLQLPGVLVMWVWPPLQWFPKCWTAGWRCVLDLYHSSADLLMPISLAEEPVLSSGPICCCSWSHPVLPDLSRSPPTPNSWCQILFSLKIAGAFSFLCTWTLTDWYMPSTPSAARSGSPHLYVMSTCTHSCLTSQVRAIIPKLSFASVP